MPNYKIFQDYPDSLRVKIYGTDGTTTQSLLTNSSGVLNVTGDVAVSGPVQISGSVAVSGPVEISGSVAVSGAVGISGSVAVSGPVEISGSVAVSGAVGISGSVAVSGPVEISGSVAVSGAVGISGSVAVSGPVQISGSVAVSGPVEISGMVGLSGHSIVDSGPATDTINSGLAGSGALAGGSYDIMSYTSWTLAVKYSGASGDQVTVILEKSALSGGVATDSDYVFDSSGNFSAGSWLLFTTGITPRYARLYYKDTGADSGVLMSYFQAQN